MDENARYSSKPGNYRQSFASSSSRRSRFPLRNPPFANQYSEEPQEEEEEEEEEVEIEEQEEEEEEQEEEERYRKKRKFRSLGSGFEFAPQVAEPSGRGGGRRAAAEWTEKSSFVLLDVWGERFMQLGRKSLRSEDWVEVAKKVSQVTRSVRTESQCRNRLDSLKKRYKIERMKMEECGGRGSKWVYFERMEILMESPPRPVGLSCGLDSGEYVFMNPSVYLERANGLDEMRDSPDNSGSDEEEDGHGDGDGGQSRKLKNVEEGRSFKLLADSIQNFGKIYQKIENNKRKMMVELEKMRMEFHKDIESQKREIMERTQAEIEKIRQEDGDDNEDDDDDDDDDDDGGDDEDEIDASMENMSN